MVITDKFVFIHEPKTGGTFVRKALDDLHRINSDSTLIARTFKRFTGKHKNKLVNKNQIYQESLPYHGTCHDIPESERGKPILSIARNPFDLYVCFYYFGWWKTHPEDSFDNFELVKEQYPHFPELSFEEFLIMANTSFDDFKLIGHQNIPLENRLGWYSTRFIRYYFKNPGIIYPLINDSYIEAKKYREDMFDVHFMRTHRLNQDLYDFLVAMGYSKSRLAFILNLEKIRPEEEAKKRPDYNWEKYYTQELKNFILRKDKLLFSLFPDFEYAI